MSQRILFCDGWLFHDGEIEVTQPRDKGPIYSQAKTETYRHGPASVYYLDRPDDFGGRPMAMLTHEKWEQVTLPHDYIVNSPITQEENNALGYRRYRPAWYRKHFTVDEAWRSHRVTLEFLGIATECDIYLNGVLLCHNETQYTPIEVEITDFIKFDNADNVIAVHVTQRTTEGWWYNGGGICHKAYVNVSDPVSLVRDGVFVAPQKEQGDVWSVPVTAEVRNALYRDVDAVVECAVLDAADRILATAQASA